MAKDLLEQDTIKTSAGDLQITFIGHGSLMFDIGGKIIHVDPVSEETDYGELPKADLILVTHEHSDHMDARAIKLLTKLGKTILVWTEACAVQAAGGVVLKNGDVKTIDGIPIEAVPAYNIEHMQPDGHPFHPRGTGNGYVLILGDKRVYVAGDTENIPEMTADAAKSFMPRILYPYHFGQTDTERIVALLKDTGIDVRIRNMK